MNAYAAGYTGPDGDKIMLFGLEKNKDNGTNDVGFWFLQGDANCAASSGGHPTWTGSTPGDVLVVSEFTTGGGVSNITAYRWAGGHRLRSPDREPGRRLQDQPGSDDDLCATTNSGASSSTRNITTPG